MTELLIIAMLLLVLVIGFALGRMWQWVSDEPGMTEDESVGMEARAAHVERLRDELCGGR